MSTTEGTNSLTFIIPIAFLFFLIAFIDPVFAEIEPLSENQMSQVSGQEGLNMVLRDFQISGDQTLRIRPDDFSNDALFLGNLTLDNGSGGGVTTGCRNSCVDDSGNPIPDDPINFDIEGSDGGRWVIELPQYVANMDQNNVTIGNAWIRDNSFASNRIRLFDEISITDAQYAGGTRLALGTEPGGGLQIGLALKLDGNVTLSDPVGQGLEATQAGGANNCTGGPTGFDIDNCTGLLNWATLEGGSTSARPLVVEMGDNEDLSVTFNPDRNSPEAGQLVVEDIAFGGTSFGEIWTNQLEIRHMQLQGPIIVSSAGNDHSGEGIEGCGCTR